MAVYPGGNIGQDPTNQFTHTLEMCRTGAALSPGRAQLLGLAACSSQSSESRRDGRTHAVNTRIPRIFVIHTQCNIESD